jgi:hypothetical protein
VLYWSVSPFGYLRAKECTNATDTRNDIVYFAYEFSDLEPMSSPDGDQIREGAILESPPYYRVGMLKEAGGIATIRPVEVYLQISDLDDVRVQTTFTAKLELKKGRTYDAARLCQEPNSNRVLTVQARPEKRQREEERQLELIQYPSPTTFGSALGGKEPSP